MIVKRNSHVMSVVRADGECHEPVNFEAVEKGKQLRLVVTYVVMKADDGSVHATSLQQLRPCPTFATGPPGTPSC